MQGTLVLDFVRPDYQGRMLALNVEKASRFACGGFFVGTHQPWAVVPPEAQMDRIHSAIQQGILIDVTDSHKDMKFGGSTVGAVEEATTGRKVYISVVPGGIGVPSAITSAEWVDDPEVQAQRDAEIEQNRRRIVTAPGMDNPDKYLLQVTPTCE